MAKLNTDPEFKRRSVAAFKGAATRKARAQQSGLFGEINITSRSTESPQRIGLLEWGNQEL